MQGGGQLTLLVYDVLSVYDEFMQECEKEDTDAVLSSWTSF